MKGYLAGTNKLEKVMAIAVAKHYGGEARFIKDCGLKLMAGSFEVLRDTRFHNDELIKFYEKNKETALLFALDCACTDGYRGVGDMMKDQDQTGALSSFTPNTFSDALYNKNDKQHAKVVGYLMRYLMQQVADNYMNRPTSLGSG